MNLKLTVKQQLELFREIKIKYRQRTITMILDEFYDAGHVDKITLKIALIVYKELSLEDAGNKVKEYLSHKENSYGDN